MKHVLRSRFPMLVVEEGGEIVGWCDVAFPAPTAPPAPLKLFAVFG